MDRYQGIGGWLILVILHLVSTLFLAFIYITGEILPILKTSWAEFTTQGGEYYHEMFGPLIIYELILNIILVVIPIILLVLMFKKSSYFPKAMIVYLISVFILHAIDAGFFYVVFSSFDLPEDFFDDVYESLLRALVYTAIWVPYFIKSKRVKATFLDKGDSSLY